MSKAGSACPCCPVVGSGHTGGAVFVLADDAVGPKVRSSAPLSNLDDAAFDLLGQRREHGPGAGGGSLLPRGVLAQRCLEVRPPLLGAA